METGQNFGQLFIPELSTIPLWWDNEGGDIYLFFQNQFFALTMEQLFEISFLTDPQEEISLVQAWK